MIKLVIKGKYSIPIFNTLRSMIVAGVLILRHAD